MRWAHSAVDYLAAAVGGDSGAGAGWGAVHERVVGNPPCAGSTGGKVCVCLDHLVTGVNAPHTAPHTVTPHISCNSPPTQLPPHSSLPHSSPPQLPPHSPPNNSLHTAMYAQVNAKPDEEEHTNSNVGTHNIAIGGTLGWKKQQQGWSKQQQHYRYSHLMQSG